MNTGAFYSQNYSKKREDTGSEHPHNTPDGTAFSAHKDIAR